MIALASSDAMGMLDVLHGCSCVAFLRILWDVVRAAFRLLAVKAGFLGKRACA